MKILILVVLFIKFHPLSHLAFNNLGIWRGTIYSKNDLNLQQWREQRVWSEILRKLLSTQE